MLLSQRYFLACYPDIPFMADNIFSQAQRVEGPCSDFENPLIAKGLDEFEGFLAVGWVLA